MAIPLIISLGTMALSGEDALEAAQITLLNPTSRADALRQMQSPEMRAKAVALGDKICREDGAAVAVRLIEGLM